MKVLLIQLWEQNVTFKESLLRTSAFVPQESALTLQLRLRDASRAHKKSLCRTFPRTEAEKNVKCAWCISSEISVDVLFFLGVSHSSPAYDVRNIMHVPIYNLYSNFITHTTDQG